MNSIGFNPSANVKNNYSKAKLSQSSSMQNTAADTVSFSGRKQKQNGGLKGIFSSLFTEKQVEKEPQKPQIDKVWLDGDGVTEADANSELATSLRSMRYTEEHKTYGEYQERMYSENAIKTIVKYQKQDAELASELINMFKYTAFFGNIRELEYLAQKQQTSPELVAKFKERCNRTHDYYHFLKAYDTNKTLTDVLYKQQTADGKPKYHPSGIFALTKVSQKLGEAVVSKYATDSRVNLYPNDIIGLCQNDGEHSAQIEELIQIVSDNNIPTGIQGARVSDILKPYISDSDTTKTLLGFGIINSNTLEQLTPAYLQAPEHMRHILTKQKDADSYGKLQISEIASYSVKAQKYEEDIKRMTGSDYKDLSLYQLKKIIDIIDKAHIEAARITKSSY